MNPPAEPYIAFCDEPSETEDALAKLQTVLTRHPIATQAVFRALVREGRRFAQSAEGSLLRDALTGSVAVSRMVLIWEAIGMGAFLDDDEADEHILPSMFLENIARAAGQEGLEPILASLFDRAR
jgi:hypothetical protein